VCVHDKSVGGRWKSLALGNASRLSFSVHPGELSSKAAVHKTLCGLMVFSVSSTGL
jgi:hypothetical protein